MSKVELLYFILLIALCLIIIFDSTTELSKNASDEEIKFTRPIVVTNLVISIVFLIISVGIYVFNVEKKPANILPKNN